MFESQTQNLRMLDRRLGTAVVMLQTEMHVAQMQQVLHRSTGGQRASLAAALAGAASLAGWQALDQGAIRRAWEHHHLARTAARESANHSVLAHVSAQSAFVLLDGHHLQPALTLIQSARREVGTRAPAVLSSWLAAAEAEATAASGDAPQTHRLLDSAQSALAGKDSGDDLPFLMLDEGHFARWRGHCLARIGDPEAADFLMTAIASGRDSVRAATGLHVDLAIALHGAGRLIEAREQAHLAREMAVKFGSTRQRNRLSALSTTHRQIVQKSDQRA